jgi:hypothetical protein
MITGNDSASLNVGNTTETASAETSGSGMGIRRV